MRDALLVEGLVGYNSLFPWSNVLKYTYSDWLQSKGFRVWHEPYNTKVLSGKKFDLVIGHSFGAGYANQNTVGCDLLITMDARLWAFWQNSRQVKNKDAKIHLNFYQKTGLRGYEVSGADNLLIGNTTHTRLPIDCFKTVTPLISKWFSV